MRLREDREHPWPVEDRGVLARRESVLRTRSTLITRDEARDRSLLVEVDEQLHGGDRLCAVQIARRAGELLVRQVAATRPDPRKNVPAAGSAVREEIDAFCLELRRICAHLGERLRWRREPGFGERVLVVHENARVCVERKAVVVAFVVVRRQEAW